MACRLIRVPSGTWTAPVSGDLDTGKATNLGQDPDGDYPVTAGPMWNDIGIWRRALTPLEVAGIYAIGASHGSQL